MNNPPYSFNEIQLYQISRFQDSLKYSSTTYEYFVRSLYERLVSRFKIEIPKAWNKDYFIFSILINGHIEVLRTSKYGIICCCGTPSGVGLYYEPTHFNFVHHKLFNLKHLKIGKECEIIKISPTIYNHHGIFDIIDFFAKKLATLDSTINQSIVNSRLAYIMSAKNKVGAKTLQSAMDLINSGKPLVVVDNPDKISLNDDMFEYVDFKTSSNYITDKLLSDYRTIFNQFDTEIGIPNLQSDKKERLIVDEVKKNEHETISRFSTWLTCLDDSIKKVKRLYPDLNLSITENDYNDEERSVKNGVQNNTQGTF